MGEWVTGRCRSTYKGEMDNTGGYNHLIHSLILAKFKINYLSKYLIQERTYRINMHKLTIKMQNVDNIKFPSSLINSSQIIQRIIKLKL